MPRIIRIAAALGALVALTAPLVSVPVSAEPVTESVEVSADAWYHVNPAQCITVFSLCIPNEGAPEASHYPAGTLHVGLTGGQETSRTYIKLDVLRVRGLGRLTGGTVRIPVAPEADGSDVPQKATLLVCLAAEPFPARTAGSLEPPPPIDCSTRTIAYYSGGTEPAVTFNLTAFTGHWNDPEVMPHGLALLPSLAAVDNQETWHLAFSSPRRTAPTTAPVSATVAYEEPLPDEEETTTTTVFEEEDEEEFEALDELLAPSGEIAFDEFAALPTGTVEVVEEVSDEQPGAAARRRMVRIVDAGYDYPVVWALPILLLLASGHVAQRLTAPITGKRRRP